MKQEETFFDDVNFIGREVESVQDIEKGMGADMDFVDEEGDGYTYDEWRDADDEHEEDWAEEPTEQMIFERIRKDLENGKKVYCGFYLNYGKYDVVPCRRTTLQSNFYVGQSVYIVDHNRLCKAQIYEIILTTSKEGQEEKYRLMYPYANRSYCKGEIYATKEELLKFLAGNIE